MKNLYCLLLGLVLCTGPVQTHAATRPSAHGLGDREVAYPVAYLRALDQQAQQLTRFLTDALHLSHRQQLAVHQVVREKLQLLAFPDEQLPQAPEDYANACTLEQYHVVMLRVLTPSQYTAFRWLEECQPTTSLLMAIRQPKQ